MPMTVEFCATCGCSEFAHLLYPDPCDDDCPPDCPGDHDDVGDNWVCDCGACDDFCYMDDPDQLVCACGCPEHDHADDVVHEDEDDLDGAPDRSCNACDCQAYLEAGTAHEVLLDAVAGRGGRWPAPRRWEADRGTVHVRWFDGPLRIVGALVAEPDGSPTRVDRRPGRDDRVYLLFAETEDGLEVAISREELA